MKYEKNYLFSFSPVSMNCVLSFPDCMLSKSVLSNVYGMQFFEWMEYTEDLKFGHCEGNNGRIYECVVLGQYCESMTISIVEI